MRLDPAPIRPPQNDTEPPQSRSTIFPMLLGVASLLIILQAFGIFKTIDSEKSTSDIDMRSGAYLQRPMPPKKQATIESSAERETLEAIADAFEGRVYTDIRTANTQENWGLSEDEAWFYERVKQYYQGHQNWLGLVKQSRQVYQRVKAIFGGSVQAQKSLDNPQRLVQISRLINQYFSIQEQDILSFAQSGQGQKISDWAFWVMTKS